MRPATFHALTAALLVATVPAPLAASDERASDIAQAMLDDLHDVSGVPGFGAAVWRDGRIVWAAGAGWRDREAGLPATGDTRFRLASVSKLMAVTALARLAEEGRVDLDAPVRDVLPWLETEWAPITLRQLAAHTSGLPHYQPVDEDRGGRHFATSREAVGVFADRPLLSPPGTRYRYSSWGYTLLGAVVEELSGESFADHVARTIAPGLDIGADATGTGDPRVSIAYEFADGAVRRAAPHDYSYTMGGGGMMASAQGLVRFGGAMVENRIVSAATFDDMARPFVLASGEPAGEASYQVGFGWRIGQDRDGHPILFHNGVTNGARSSLVLWREEGSAAAILSNAMWTSSIDATGEMIAAAFRTPPAGLKPADCPLDARWFSGSFGDQAVAGVVRFETVEGLCRGQIELTGGWRDYFGSGPQPVASHMRVVGLDADGGLSRAALVTPYGIYDLRADGAGGFAARLSLSRSLAIRFDAR